jgi:NADH-quinone oxidoreductase subunit J
MALPVLFFVVIGAISIAAAIGVITSNQPVHSALFLLLNFASLAVLYVMLDAQFLAAVQIIVYAGGIVILILFVIMLLGSEDLGAAPRKWTGYAGLILGVLLATAIAASLGSTFAGDQVESSTIEGGVPIAVGMELFTKYILPVELTAVLLLVALIGALLMGRFTTIQSLPSKQQPQVKDK